MPYRIVDPADLAAEPGPHPAASPFDKRLTDALGLNGFEVYQVELPAGAGTVAHDHIHDQVEDAYVFLSGDGWLVVDDEHIRVEPGHYVSVTVDSRRHVAAGDDGLTFVAICGPTT